MKTTEQFDLNATQVSGIIQKLWGRNSDVYARLRVSTRGYAEETEDAFSHYVNLRFPEGGVQGKPASLSPGMPMHVAGFLTHTQYQETIMKSLDAANAPDFLETVPEADKAVWRSLRFQRRNAMLNVQALQWTEEKVSLGDKALIRRFGNAHNSAIIEGIVARLWEFTHDDGIHLFARIACYDEHTPIAEGQAGKAGRSRRMPHYLTVKLVDGKAGGYPVRLEKKMRVRVTGHIAEQGTRVTLREQLLDTGSERVIELLGRLPNADRLNEISSQQSSMHIEAEALIVYSAGRKRLKQQL